MKKRPVVRWVIAGDVPSSHPALRLLEELLGRATNPPILQGSIILYINGGRITDIHPDYLIPSGVQLELQWTPLTNRQQVAVQAVADLLPQLERARMNCRLILRLQEGEPVLPLVFQGRYTVSYSLEEGSP